MAAYVVVDDGQTAWVADRQALIAALDALGWDRTRRMIYAARLEPTGDDPYSALCESVQALPVEPRDEMARLAWYSAENAWLWDRDISSVD